MMVCGEINKKNTNLRGRYVFRVRVMALTDMCKNEKRTFRSFALNKKTNIFQSPTNQLINY